MSQTNASTDPEPLQTQMQSAVELPSSWYTAPEVFQLERRAIFSRQWLLTTHSQRFSKTGDWVRLDIAGFNILLTRDKDGTVNAFHNVCRHRAFPVVTEDRGTSRIFSCKYHGWSYGLNGKLAKAPGYQDLTGFDKSKNGLLSIHAHTDTYGFIWVNLDGAETPELDWEGAPGLDGAQLDSSVNAEAYCFDHIVEMAGDFNWKILAGGGQLSDRLRRLSGANPSLAASLRDNEADSVIAATSIFPNSSVVVLPNALLIQRCVPLSSTRTSMYLEVYRENGSSDEAFHEIDNLLQRILTENKRIFEAAQADLQSSAASPNGESEDAPRAESPRDFAGQVRGLVTEFRHREEAAGHEIWPSRQILPPEATTSRGDLDFCSRLTTQGQTAGDCTTLEPDCHGRTACQSANPALAY
ncbi:hypothetical protein PDE_04265 [Penicillium oxalicum 114-2]|uniref:Rieske domain-containing protein n=1 Tax=Penicillium oxalicum (strain 114-2 / CGMCC 5302) TaxID=933388 RepID=S7ZKX7_PENO1|nr:hypothetical protein PDE_04265 [Penicillium oxalicum 114-2]